MSCCTAAVFVKTTTTRRAWSVFSDEDLWFSNWLTTCLSWALQCLCVWLLILVFRVNMPYCSRHWQLVTHLKQHVGVHFIYFTKFNFLFQEVKNARGFPDKVFLTWFRSTKWKFGLVGTFWTCRNSTRTGRREDTRMECWSCCPFLVLSGPGGLSLSCGCANSTVWNG